VVSSCKYGDEPSVFGAVDLVIPFVGAAHRVGH
jgi:hypothetical protein